MEQSLIHKDTKILGLIGHPIKQTLSPLIHNESIRRLDLDFIYLPFDVPGSNLKDALRGVLALGLKGFNVTLPHKETILPHLHDLSQEASIIGSVNTVVNDMGKLIGYNTDVNGIYETLIPFKDDISGQQVSIIGAGGSARAAIYTLLRYFKPEKINIINRTEQRAETLKEYFSNSMKFENFEAFELLPPDLTSVFTDSKLIINSTSVGMIPLENDSPVLDNKVFHKDQIVFDFVYNPVTTQFLKLAGEKGAITLDGLTMLVHQAAKSFVLWTGQEMPIHDISGIITDYIINNPVDAN
jgi:shikimate dehydrogenase